MSDWDDDWKNPIFDDNWENPVFDDNNSGGNHGNKRGVFLGIGACLFFIGLIVVGIVAINFERGDEAQQAELSRAAIPEAFEAENVGVGDAQLNELKLFFDRLIEASLTENAITLRNMFDEERYFQQVQDCGVISTMTSFEKKTLRENLRERCFGTGWANHVIIHVDPLSKPSEYLVYVHLSNEDNTSEDNYRFWLARSNRGWKLFDWELIEFGMSKSVEDALLFEYSLDHGRDEFLSCTHDLGAAFKLLEQGEHQKAADKIREAERRNVHPKFKNNASLRIAYAWSHLSAWRECLDATERISSPDLVPGYYSMQVQVYDRWRHSQKVADLAAKHEVVAGIDPFVVEARCRALEELSRLEEAVPALRKWLRWAPENMQAMQYFGRALPEDQQNLLIEHLERVSDPAQTAVTLVEHLAYSDELEMSRLLVKFVEQTDPEAARVDYLRGLVERTEGNFEQAAELILKAQQAEQDEELKSTYLWEYIGSMVDLGKIVEAYESLEDRNEAFQSLAEWIDLDEDDSLTARQNMQSLIEAHRQTHPDDPWLHYYTAVLREAEQRYEEASAALQEAARTDDEDLLSMVEYRRVDVLLAVDRAQEAYESAENPDETFRQIAGYYQRNEKPEELRELIETHKSAFPDNPWLNYYRGVAYLLEEKFDEAEAIFERESQSSEVEYVQNSSRSSLHDSMFESKGAVEAYRQQNLSEEVFQRYANRLFYDDNFDELKALVHLHELHHPEDVNLLSWKVDELWRAKDYAAIVHNYSEMHPAEEGPSRPWQYEGLEDQVLRSFLRLNRFPEAIAYADSRFQEDGQVDNLLIAHLAAGNLDEAREAFKLHNDSTWSLSAIYSDEDVGERLHSEEFRSLREQFPPPLPYYPLAEIAVLFLDEPSEFDSGRLHELVDSLVEGEVIVSPIEGERGASVFLIESEDLTFLLTHSDSEFIPDEDPADHARELKDPQLQSALRDHRAWVSLGVLTGRRNETTQDEQTVGYEIVSKLIDEHCLGLFFENEQRIMLPAPDLRQVLESDSPDEKLKDLGEELWLYIDPPYDPAESLETQRCQARLHQIAKAFADRTPDQEFLMQVELSANHVKEFHWISVDSVRKKPYGDYRITGQFQSASKIFPGVAVGEPVAIRKYEVYDWKYPSGDQIIQGRTSAAE